MGLNLNPYSNTPIKNLEYIQNKALVIAPFEITKNGKLDPDLLLDTPGFITMYFFRKNFDSILKEPTAEQFKVVGTVSDISTKLGLDITDSNISSSSSSSYYLGFTKIAVIFKYDKNTGIRTIEKDTSLLSGDYTDISIDSTVDLTTEDYFVICNVTKNTKVSNSSFTESNSMDFLFMIPSVECQELITDFDILDVNNQVINVKKYGTLDSDFIADNDITFEPAYQADFFGDGSNIATYLFDGNCNDETGNYNGTPINITYTKGKFDQAAVFNGSNSLSYSTLPTGLKTYKCLVTISCWAKTTNSTEKQLIMIGDSTKFIYGMNCSGFGMNINNGTTAYVLAGTSNIVTDNIWHHYVGIYDGISSYFYIDGILKATSSVVSTNGLDGNGINGLNIGCLSTNYPTSYFNGQIDNVRIFNRALNQREVLELYNEQSSYEEQLTLTEVTGKTLTPSGNPLVVYDKDNGPSIKFVNNRDYLTCPGSNDFAFGTGDFTVESWVKFNNPFSTYPIQYICGLNTTGGIGFGIENGNLNFATRTVPFEINYSWVPTTGVWYHLAATRENGIMKLWINGSNVATKTNTKNLSVKTGTFYIGAFTPNLSDNFYGNISQLHIVKGIAKYSSNFTPESRLLRTPNTVLLLQVDKPVINTNNWSKVQLESVEIIENNVDQPLSIVDPKRKDFFGDKSMVACYMLDSNANDETGMYNGILNGSNFVTTTGKFGQCVSVNDTNYVDLPETLSSLFGINDFSISLWFKPSGTFVTYNTIFATHSSNSSGFFNLHINSNNKISVSLFDGDSRPSISHQDNIKLTDWNHVVVTKKSNVYTIYSNNIISGSTITNTLSIASTDIRLGQNPAAPTGEYFSGQLDNVKIFNRALTQDEVTSLYNEIVSPVITLETEIETIASEPDFFNDKSNIATYLFNYNETDILNLLGEDFSDVTGKTITNNGVTIDTTNKASGSGSYKFSNNSYISLPTSNDFAFGTGDFTIECDFYLITFNINGAIILEGRPDNTNGTYITFGLDGAGKFGIFSNGASILTSNATLVTNKWYHLSCKRRNGIFTLFIDGVLDATSGVTSINFTRNTFIIGKNAFSSIVNTTWVGNIDNIKLSRHAILDANGKYNIIGNMEYDIGKFGQCAKFNGSTYLNLDNNNYNFNTVKSISLWFKTSDTSSSYSTILCYKGGTGILDKAIIALNRGKLYLEGTNIVSNTLYNDNKWHHVVITNLSGTTYNWYINGMFVTTKVHTSLDISYIGCDGQSPNEYYIGLLDNVRIFNRALTASEVQDLYRETKRVKYKAITLDKTNFRPAAKFNIETQKEIKLLNFKTWTRIDETSQGYRIYPVMKIQDHTAEETSFSPKYFLGAKYQRNLAEVLLPSIKSKRTISNLKDMYLVDDQCIQTLNKINILLETDQMIKFTERLYNLDVPLREKLNADLILEYLSIPVIGISNNDITETLKTSLIEDYNFTQSEINNLNDNLNTFKSRARMNISTPVIQGSNGSLDQVKFSLPQTFVDGNRSQTEKKNLLVFGTDAGFNKFGLSGYSTPYSNVTKRDTSVVLDYNNLTLGLPALSSQNFKPVVDDKTFMMYSGSLTDATGKRPTLTGGSLSTTTKKFNNSSIYINNSFITIPAGANLSIGTKDFTVETWINPTSIDVYIFTLGLNRSQCCFAVLLSNGAVLFRAGSGGWSWNLTSDRITASNLVKANTWNHIVTQRRNGNLEIYINGILYYTGVWAYNIPNGTNLYIGGYVGDSNITAYYDDISISNGVGRYTSTFTLEISDGFKDILTNYKQQIPFSYIPLSTDINEKDKKPVFETLTNITGFSKSEIIIDIPNVL